MEKKVAYYVTGATGHLGRTIVEQLLKLDFKVYAFSLPNDNGLNKLVKEYKGLLEVINGNILSKDDVVKFIKNNELYLKRVIHCASLISISQKYDERIYNINVNGVKNITDVCLEDNVDNFIYVSSVHALEEKKKGIISETSSFDPEKVRGLYAKTKATSSNYVLSSVEKGLRGNIVMPSGFLGPNDYLLGRLTGVIRDYLSGSLTAIVRGGYDIVDVRDVSNAILTLANTKSYGKTYILNGHYITIARLLEIVSVYTKKKPIKVVLPYWFVKMFIPLISLHFILHKSEPLFTLYSLTTLRTNSNFCHFAAEKDLDYHPRNLDETIKDTIDFIYKNKQIKEKVKDKTHKPSKV
ncbi:MAG: SDR family NAD(P)-dependent oxidoreductase [Bacilli bacterium]